MKPSLERIACFFNSDNSSNLHINLDICVTLILYYFKHFLYDLNLFWWVIILFKAPSTTKLLAETNKVCSQISWHLAELMMLSIFLRAPEPPSTKQPQNTNDPPPYSIGFGGFFHLYSALLQPFETDSISDCALYYIVTYYVLYIHYLIPVVFPSVSLVLSCLLMFMKW